MIWMLPNMNVVGSKSGIEGSTREATHWMIAQVNATTNGGGSCEGMLSLHYGWFFGKTWITKTIDD